MGAALPSFSRKGTRGKSHHCFSLVLLRGISSGAEEMRGNVRQSRRRGRVKELSTVTFNEQGDYVLAAVCRLRTWSGIITSLCN